MTYFKDSDEVYRYIGRVFEEIAADDELGPKFERANTIVQYRMRDPESLITVRMRPGEERRVDLGETELEPEVVMTMAADTAHRFWLDELSIAAAMSRGQIKARGPVSKILKLVPLVKPVFPRYREILEGDGRWDLLEAG